MRVNRSVSVPRLCLYCPVCLYVLKKPQQVDFRSPEHLQLKPHFPCSCTPPPPSIPALPPSLPSPPAHFVAFWIFPGLVWVVFILALFVFAFPCCAASLSYVGMSSHILATVAACVAVTCVTFLIIDSAVFSSADSEILQCGN